MFFKPIDKGKGKGGGGPKPPGGCPGKGPGGGAVADGGGAAAGNKKQETPYFHGYCNHPGCGQFGHWSLDEECPKNGGAGTPGAAGAPDFTSPARQVAGQINKQRELFAEAMKRLDKKPGPPREPRGFSSDPKVAINRSPARQGMLKQDPLTPLVPGGAGGSGAAGVGLTGAAGYTSDSAAAATTTATATETTAASAAGADVASKAHKASSFAAYLAAKKASKNTSSVTSRRVVRRDRGGGVEKTNEDKDPGRDEKEKE